MTALLVLGLVGLVLLLASVLFGDLDHEGTLDVTDLGLGRVTMPALSAGLAAYGLGGALLSHAGVAGPLAAVGALVPFAAVSGLTVWGTGVLIGEQAQPARTTDLLGAFGSVLTPIPEQGFGQVVVAHHGHRATFTARSSRAVPAGAQVYVLEIASPTCLVVEPFGL